MLTLLIAATMLQAEPQKDVPAPESPAALVSRMIGRYSKANSLVGTIRFTQQLASASIGIDTELQVEKPSKLYIRQVRRSSDPRQWLVTSNGNMFSYNAPFERSRPGERLVEPVSQGGAKQDVRQIYSAVTASIGDRSMPLDVLIGRVEDLKYRRFQWATMAYLEGPGNKIRVVGGSWREYGDAVPTGTYEMWISEAGDLVKVIQKETISPDPRSGPQTIISTWDVAVKVNAPLNQALFTLAR